MASPTVLPRWAVAATPECCSWWGAQWTYFKLRKKYVFPRCFRIISSLCIPNTPQFSLSIFHSKRTNSQLHLVLAYSFCDQLCAVRTQQYYPRKDPQSASNQQSQETFLGILISHISTITPFRVFYDSTTTMPTGYYFYIITSVPITALFLLAIYLVNHSKATISIMAL